MLQAFPSRKKKRKKQKLKCRKCFNNKDKLSTKVEITNTGKSLLVIRSLHMYSDALRVTLGKSELAPGQKTTLKITAEHNLMSKARTQPRVLMITNDPNKAKVVIKIKQL